MIKKHIKKISSNADCSAQQLYGGYVFSEDVTFRVSRSELERVLADKGKFPYIDEADAWNYAVQTQSRGVLKSIFVRNEIKALLQGVDFYLKSGTKALSEAILKAKDS